jgi:hypothetical protein
MTDSDDRAGELVVQSEVGGMTIAFTVPLPDSEAALRWEIDRLSRGIDHARARQMLVEARADLWARRKALDTIGERREAALAALEEKRLLYKRRRAAERARLIASFQAAIGTAGMGRRAEGLGNQEKKSLAEFDAQTEVGMLADEYQEQPILDQFDAEQKRLPGEVAQYEAAVYRQEQILAGTERADVVGLEPTR